MKTAAAIILLFAFFPFGLSAQDSTHVHASRKKFGRAIIVPAALLVTALAVANNDFLITRREVSAARNRAFPHFHTYADNYLQFAPAVVVYGLDLFGLKGKNNIANQTALLVKTEILVTAIVSPLKNITHELRPDGSNRQSFPSGHTAQAFAAATFLQKEYGQRSIWYSIGGYTVATVVGALRILNNKHWLPDVLVGAGIGILSTNLVYLTHQYRWNKKGTQAFITPTYAHGPGLYFCYRFH